MRKVGSRKAWRMLRAGPRVDGVWAVGVRGCRLQSVWGRLTQLLLVNAAPGLSVELCVSRRLANGLGTLAGCEKPSLDCARKNSAGFLVSYR